MVDTVISRHRPLAVLAATVLAQVLLLAFQIKRDHDVRLIRYWAEEVVTPFERFGTWSLARVGGVWTGYIALRGAHAENARLRAELAQLQLRNRQLESQSLEAQRLSVLLNFRDVHSEASMLAAQVIGASADPASHTLVLNRGERDRVRRNMGVITPEGVVGKIVEVFPTTSQVLLMSDKDSGVGALLADTRTHGVVKGSGDPEPRMDYVVNDEKVHLGEMILTSGEDRIFPKGLLVGTVAVTKEGNPFQIIHIQPAARLDRLEDVLILLTQQDLYQRKTDDLTDATRPSPPSGIVQTGALASALPPKAGAASPTNPSAPANAHPAPAEAPPAPRN
ncbi:MAG TPA: rod shape-determining protein MreC [Candidatus Acidoferrales bacterium]|nr:rod shape-determining protein MreC [Candidatus Acidoferrales bacterium]